MNRFLSAEWKGMAFTLETGRTRGRKGSALTDLDALGAAHFKGPVLTYIAEAMMSKIYGN